jgi:hypothetical protein
MSGLDGLGWPAAEENEIPEGNEIPEVKSSAHDRAWEQKFVLPIAKEMKARGVAYLLITIRDDGKAAYVLEPVETEC